MQKLVWVSQTECKQEIWRPDFLRQSASLHLWSKNAQQTGEARYSSLAHSLLCMVTSGKPMGCMGSRKFVYFSTGGLMWTTEVRVEMAKKGLYMKHSIDHPLLAGFNNYLHTDLGNKSSKQEVSELNEWMYKWKKKCVCVALVRNARGRQKLHKYESLKSKNAQQTGEARYSSLAHTFAVHGYIWRTHGLHGQQKGVRNARVGKNCTNMKA